VIALDGEDPAGAIRRGSDEETGGVLVGEVTALFEVRPLSEPVAERHGLAG
jgi:hypothetical protein